MLFAVDRSLAPGVEEVSTQAGVARVQLEGSAALELDYAVPQALAEKVRIGSRVMVPLQRQLVPGVVLDLMASSAHGHRLKEIASLQGRGDPVFTPVLIKLAHWVADYYLCPVSHVLRAMLPPRRRCHVSRLKKCGASDACVTDPLVHAQAVPEHPR
jgi:primosomal protein N' (replication factor Y)